MKIAAIKYFKLSWLVPFASSILALVIEELLHRLGIKLPNVLSEWIGIASLGIMFFFIPYTVMVVALLIFLQNRSMKAHIIMILLSPLLMTLLVSLFVLLTNGYKSMMSGMTDFYGRYSLIVGYCYVSLIFILYGTLRRCQIIEN